MDNSKDKTDLWQGNPTLHLYQINYLTLAILHCDSGPQALLCVPDVSPQRTGEVMATADFPATIAGEFVDPEQLHSAVQSIKQDLDQALRLYQRECRRWRLQVENPF